jgi:hypothetical protein
MAGNVISSLFGKKALTIYNQTYGYVSAKDLKISKVTIKLSSDPQRHMMEDGSAQIDTRTIKGIRIQMEVFCPDNDTLLQLNDIVSDRSSLYQITSRGLIIPDMMIDSELMKQMPEVLSATPIKLTFKQVMIEGKNPIVMNNAADASLIDRGLAIVNDATETVGELYDKAAGAASNLLG